MPFKPISDPEPVGFLNIFKKLQPESLVSKMIQRDIVISFNQYYAPLQQYAKQHTMKLAR
jgi:hypothetical protein